jgi:hypothetical protein
MNKPNNIQNTNICNGIFHISFFKALLINEGETTRGERDSGRNDPDSGMYSMCGMSVEIPLILHILTISDKGVRFPNSLSSGYMTKQM